MPEQPHHDKHGAHRQLVARLRRQADDVRRFTAGLDEALLAKRVITDKWSLKELVCHLWRVEQVFEGRINAVLAQDNPPIARYDPEGDAEFDKLVAKAGAESLAGFLADREKLAARLDGFSPADWHRPGRSEFPHYDVHFQVEYMAHHEAHHVCQMLQRRVPLGKLPH
ncbi:MAG: DinB family protein [Acidobacteria bacterium]|nr:DinB family protein [Acidobacteriota bacterium]